MLYLSFALARPLLISPPALPAETFLKLRVLMDVDGELFELLQSDEVRPDLPPPLPTSAWYDCKLVLL